MRQKIVAGNWKMNTNLKEGIELALAVNDLAENKKSDALVIVAPPFIHLSEVKKVLGKVKLSSQNCAAEESGAYTGEVSVDMIKSTGAEYVIIGHSERRAYYHEDDQVLAKKTDLTLSRGLLPIFCIGEELKQRESGKHFEVVKSQLEKGVFHLSEADFRKVVIAYEPVWAIGTGVTASSDQAQEMHKFIRDEIAGKYSPELADSITILYGGSCKPSNAAELFANPDVDGGLIGGASLKAEDFIQIVNAFLNPIWAQMQYLQIRFLLPNQNDNIFDILSAELFNAGYEGFNQSDNELFAFIREADFDTQNLKDILSKSVFQNFEILTEKSLLPEKNWNEEWEKDFNPVIIDNICEIIAPFHKRTGTLYSILIEPKMSFGTGHHETTRLMIRQIYQSDLMDKDVLDMGCGTGVLGIFSLQRKAENVTSIDIDDWACENSEENFLRNGLSPSRFKIIKGDASSIPDTQFGTILANINRNILLNDMKHYFQHLGQGGELIISGILNTDREPIIKYSSRLNLSFVSELYENNWISLKFKK